jgi:peptidoglycan L-alanyl-D-glutamate endopeptidase CwlK
MARATILIFSGIFWVALFSIFWATNSISHEGGFSERSKQHLAEIHDDLYEVVFLARLISEVPFEITDGLRTIEEQRDYFNNGFSKTMKSKHLDGLAVDVVPIPVTWEPEAFLPIAEAMKQAADILDTPIVWGGDWRTFKDYPHFELKERPDGH